MKILIVDDDKTLQEKMLRFFRSAKIEAVTADNGLSAQRVLEQTLVEAVVTDLDMPGLNGLGLLKWIREHQPLLPVIIMSGYGEIKDAVEAMQHGAKDYVVKPFEPDLLLAKVQQFVTQQAVQAQITAAASTAPAFQDWIGASIPMQEIKTLIEQIAPTPATVLITGESGTGKEVVARLIHQLSPRAKGPFVALNLSGIPETLLESELFGYEKGAFTGAFNRKIGLFEVASNGTLLLDEIGDMPLHLQVKLLRVLQEREIQRVGGTEMLPIDVRILAATNKNLEEQIMRGQFREGLYYRLNIIRVTLPALRDRAEDIPLLVGHFIQKFSHKVSKTITGMTPEALAALQNYKFPGNVRELENILERASIFAKTDQITLTDLGMAAPPAKAYTKRGSLEELEKQAIIEALQRWEGNRSRAADELGINRKTLLNKIKEYGIEE
jgi:two-component system, NtrC family, response regulator AtoC